MTFEEEVKTFVGEMETFNKEGGVTGTNMNRGHLEGVEHILK